MDWRLVLAVLCMISASALADTSSNQTAVDLTLPNTSAVFNLVFSINETFDAALANNSSPKFAEKATSIRTQLEPIYRQTFKNFLRMIIHGFRNGSIVTNSSLEFSANGSIPTQSTVKDALVNATTTNSSLNIITTSINVTEAPKTNTSSPNTTSPPNTTTTSPVVAAVFNLVFSINETFDAALANNSSPQFAAKATSIRTQLEPIYRQTFKNFLRMIIHGFRNGSIVTNSSLEFSANDSIPTQSTVKDAVVNATTANSSLNIIPNSINVTEAPKTNTSSPNTTSPPNTNTTSPVVAAVFNLVFSINETFDAALANNSSPQFAAKATSIRTQLEPIYRQTFKNFLRMIIHGFRNGSIVTNSSLEFSANDSIPTQSTVKDALVNATTTNSSLNIITTSINVTEAPKTNFSSPNTTSPLNTTTTSPVVAAVFNLVFSINETFDAALANNSSPQFAAKATSIRTQLEPIYRQTFKNFLRMIIHGFRNGSIVTNSSLEFSANDSIPTQSTVKDVLVNATTANSSLNIIPNSINVTEAPKTNTSSPNTTSPPNTNTTSPVVAAVFNLVFSISETFDAALANNSSPQFAAKATSIRTQLEPIYRQTFKNFLRMIIHGFRSGSIVTNSSLEFSANDSIPTQSTVKDALVNATTTNSSLNIITTSINVTEAPKTNFSSPNTTSPPNTNTTSPVVAAVFNLVFSINETFDAALANTSSPQFAAKATSIRTQLEPIYRQTFKNFLRMIIHGFRNGSIVTNSSLEFSANDSIPTESTVKDVLVNATTANSSLNIIPNSINVTEAPKTNTSSPNTTSPPSTTTTSPVVAAVFNLVFSINETFDAALANNSSPQFAAKATSIRTQLEPIYRQTFKNFLRMIIHGFRNGSIVTNSSLEFSANDSIPTESTVKDVLVNATTANSSLNIIPNSINVTEAPKTNTSSPNTTSPPSTTTTSPVVAAVFNLVFSINETFDAALANTSSPQFAAKATSIRQQLEPIYRKIFKNFLRMIIHGFRSGSIVTNSSLEFSANDSIPTESTVKDVLVIVATANSSLNIITDSINATQTFVTTTTTSTTTTTPSTPEIAVSIFNLIFSINETFDAALANTSSPQFVNKATSIRTQVEPLYKKAFKNFIIMKILKFRNGSIVTESTLFFSPDGPNVTAAQVKNTLLDGLKNLTFTVDPNSINVTQTLGNSMPPVIASSLSVIWMSLLSLLLSVALHFEL